MNDWKRWFHKQCCDHFAEWLIGILLALVGCVVSVASMAGLWAYSMHGCVSAMQEDVKHVAAVLIEHKQDSQKQWEKLADHDKQLQRGSERISRIEGMQAIPQTNKGG